MTDMVSIILPVYNSREYIAQCIDSIMGQQYKDWELIVVDDFSDDGSREIISDYVKRDERIRYFRLERNSGAGIARNTAIEKAGGKYIAFIDSDDRWDEGKLEKQIGFMEKNNYPLTYSDYYIVEPSGRKKIFRNVKTRVNLRDLIRFNYIACSTVIYNTAVLGKKFMPDYRNRQDWALWIDLLDKTDYANCLSEPLTFYQLRKDSISSNKVRMIRYHWLIYRDHLEGNFFLSLFRLIRNIIFHIYYGVRKGSAEYS